MAATPRFKVYTADGEYVAACKFPEDAGAIIALHGDRSTDSGLGVVHERKDWIDMATAGTKSKRTSRRAAATSRDIKRAAKEPRTKLSRGTTKREKPASAPKRETAKAVLDEKYGRAHVDPTALKSGQKLTAKYGGVTYSATVITGGDGKSKSPRSFAFLVKGKTYKSLSAAGNAITGNSVNGRRFWSAAS